MKRRRGITLLELMVSLSVVLLLCIFVLNLFPQSLIGLRHSEVRLDAQHLADSVIAQAEAAGFSSWTLGTSQTLPPQTINGLTFTPVLVVSAVAGYDPNAVRSFKVSVTWTERSVSKQLTQESWKWHGG